MSAGKGASKGKRVGWNLESKPVWAIRNPLCHPSLVVWQLVSIHYDAAF
jgi:hypothetical protein